jgi:hypothetical protein
LRRPPRGGRLRFCARENSAFACANYVGKNLPAGRKKSPRRSRPAPMLAIALPALLRTHRFNDSIEVEIHPAAFCVLIFFFFNSIA